MAERKSSVTIVIVLYLQVFTSPFHRHHQYYTSCKAVDQFDCYSSKTEIKRNTSGGGTTVVSSGRFRDADQAESGNYCEKLPQSLQTNRSLHFVGLSSCLSTSSKATNQVRKSTCGVKFEGSIATHWPNWTKGFMRKENEWSDRVGFDEAFVTPEWRCD